MIGLHCVIIGCMLYIYYKYWTGVASRYDYTLPKKYFINVCMALRETLYGFTCLWKCIQYVYIINLKFEPKCVHIIKRCVCDSMGG